MEIKQIQNIHEALEILWQHDVENQKINFPHDQPNRSLFEKNILESYREQPQGFFFLFDQEKIIGSLLLRMKINPFRNQQYGEVWYIYLDSAYRGKGLGATLLEHAEQYFKQNKCSYIFAGISASNPGSNALFEKTGYKKTRIILEKPLP